MVDVERRRAEITDAAARLIARSGIESATMREVAAEAGWTTGAVTHYFADKRELLLTTFQDSLAKRQSLRLAANAATPAEQLRASLEGALPLDEDRRRHWLVTLACCTQASGDERLADAQRQAYREFRDRVTALVTACGLVSHENPRGLAERLIAGADGIAIQALFDAESFPPERQLALLDTFLADG